MTDIEALGDAIRSILKSADSVMSKKRRSGLSTKQLEARHVIRRARLKALEGALHLAAIDDGEALLRDFMNDAAFALGATLKNLGASEADAVNAWSSIVLVAFQAFGTAAGITTPDYEKPTPPSATATRH